MVKFNGKWLSLTVFRDDDITFFFFLVNMMI